VHTFVVELAFVTVVAVPERKPLAGLAPEHAPLRLTMLLLLLGW
jgi:hypothetical protein